MAFPHPQGPLPPPSRRAGPGACTTRRSSSDDACGVAFVADLHGRRSHDVVAKGLSALCRLDHRGARGAEHNTGDGAGIMIQVPDEFLREVVDFALPPAGQYATGLVFLPTDGADAARARSRCWRSTPWSRAREILGWRDVPVDPAGLGETARAARPRIRQVFLAAHRLTGSPAGPAGTALTGLELDRVAFCVRKQAERETARARRAGLLPVAVRAHDHLQGHAHARTSCRRSSRT